MATAADDGLRESREGCREEERRLGSGRLWP
jgi:hypothetical protein